jgi:hypothetical protein
MVSDELHDLDGDPLLHSLLDSVLGTIENNLVYDF